jgi:hypothetical protein
MANPTDSQRRLCLLSGLPYLRQVVRRNGELFTVMAYNFLNPPQVQLAPGIRNTALGWDTDAGEWVSWTKCEINREDAAWLKEHREAQAQPAARKAMPPPTRPHPVKREPARQEVKHTLRKERGTL